MVRSEHGTRAGTAYERMRSDILAGRLQPGERLKFPDLSGAYGVGVGAIREALARLVEQGFVRSHAHAGFHVTPVSTEDLLDLTEARVEIEGSVLRRSVVHGGVEWESEVVAKHHTLARTPLHDAPDPERMSDDWARAHRDFHASLLAACDNRRLHSLAGNLRDAALLYQAWSQQLRRERERDAAAEHRKLMELALARDADAAAEALAAHIRRTTELVLADAPPDPLAEPGLSHRVLG